MRKSPINAMNWHFLKKQSKSLPRCIFKSLLSVLPVRASSGKQRFDSSRPIAIVVSHSTCLTGAPILALNLCQLLARNHNVVVVLLRGGALRPEFRKCSTAILQGFFGVVSRVLFKQILAYACQGQKPAFALVNSVESTSLLKPLRSQGVPCISLVHEFASGPHSPERFIEAGIWASRMVFSTELTLVDMQRCYRYLLDVPVVVIPQGKCELPVIFDSSEEKSFSHVDSFLSGLSDDTLLVLGAGTVCPRKGVDLFVSVAKYIHDEMPACPIHFAWIGSGYDPEADPILSVWIKDQIERSGLSEKFTMLDESAQYDVLMDRSHIFIMSSRLDPLPNVAIDAMLSGIPVLCFEKACGIANIFEQIPILYSSCVASYFDCSGMAHRAIALLRSPQHYQQISSITFEQAQRLFNMSYYLQQLLSLLHVSRVEVRQHQADLDSLINLRIINQGFCFSRRQCLSSRRSLYQIFLLKWRSNIAPPKPFPGFHPGIYREHCLPDEPASDPTIHWATNGRPAGPWLAHVIQPGNPISLLPHSQVGLHIHVFYPELLDLILHRLGGNKIKPNLFISYSGHALEYSILKILEARQLHASLHSVPNRGRDLGPLLTEIGLHLERNFELYGHIHTKKSVLVASRIANRWFKFLLGNLLGDRKNSMADNILASFNQNPSLGLVFPDDPGCLGWTENRNHAELLAARLALPRLPEAINFPVGSMFWARRGALSRLYELGLSWDDYPCEPVGYDGTLLHAIERLLPQVCMASGYQYAVTYVPGLSR